MNPYIGPSEEPPSEEPPFGEFPTEAPSTEAPLVDDLLSDCNAIILAILSGDTRALDALLAHYDMAQSHFLQSGPATLAMSLALGWAEMMRQIFGRDLAIAKARELALIMKGHI